MFAAIAPNYDRANQLLSFGLYQKWNKALVNALEGPQILLDLCAGTGDIALDFLQTHPFSKAILLDFCPEMLEKAKEKGAALKERFQTLVADAQSIPLANDSVDAVTISYGIRNVKNPLLAFQDAFRVLKKGGVFGILELTRPQNPFLHFGHKLYLRTLLPIVGKIATRDKNAYAYLSKSITNFSAPDELEKQLESCGFVMIKKKSLTFGAATLILAHKD